MQVWYEKHLWKYVALSLTKMLSDASAFRISGHKLKPEDNMQQCYMPCGRRNNNSPATGALRSGVNQCANEAH